LVVQYIVYIFVPQTKTNYKNMSTTFGVRIPSTGLTMKIARRVGIGNGKVEVWFTNNIAELLDDNQEVIAMDNSSQGIQTIKDIKKIIKIQ
jgi:hypothetical protein